jgi:hypothetical protein
MIFFQARDAHVQNQLLLCMGPRVYSQESPTHVITIEIANGMNKFKPNFSVVT